MEIYYAIALNPGELMNTALVELDILLKYHQLDFDLYYHYQANLERNNNWNKTYCPDCTDRWRL